MEPVGGTSASSPTFAGLVSLLNEARLDAGKPAMGFLNPFLYKHADDFFDVVKGSNKVNRRRGQPHPARHQRDDQPCLITAPKR